MATLLRCILCLQDVSQINVGTIWSIRETFVGIIAVNLPVLKPFIQRAGKVVSSVKHTHDTTGSGGVRDSIRLSYVKRSGKKRTVHAITDADNESEERIVIDQELGERASGTFREQRAIESASQERVIRVTKSHEVSLNTDRI